MDELDELREKLEKLQSEHRDLDAEIARLTSEQPFDQLQVQRLKKRKLALKDQIIALHERLIPDIIA
ncbi:MAG: YdcH family protein [Reyranellaceae bacterium]